MSEERDEAARALADAEREIARLTVANRTLNESHDAIENLYAQKGALCIELEGKLAEALADARFWRKAQENSESAFVKLANSLRDWHARPDDAPGGSAEQ